MLIHLTPTIPCIGPGCPRTLETFPDMVIHLESGVCFAGVEIKSLNKSAAYVYKWKQLVDGAYGDNFIHGKELTVITQDGDNVKLFVCPGCSKRSAKLFELFQHVGSLACSGG